MLQAYLVSIGITAASRVLFVADGAAWISRRIPKLIRALGLQAEQVRLTHRRMDYATSRNHQMPIGSGAIESAIRRVVNLRVKSNATYWLRENAETMIRLRAWIKAGRGENLFNQTTYAPITLAL